MLKASRAGVLRFGTTIKLVLVFVGFGLVAWVFFQLFKNRGLLSAQDMYLFFPGDMELRPLYEHLLTMSSGALAPLYKAANYIAQSPAVFSELFDAHLPENAYLVHIHFELQVIFFRLFQVLIVYSKMHFLGSTQVSSMGLLLIGVFSQLQFWLFASDILRPR